MTEKVYTIENQIDEWVEGAKNVELNFGTGKALGYVIGEKFYGILKDLRLTKKVITGIEEKRKKTDYNPVTTTTVSGKTYKINLDDEFEHHRKSIMVLKNSLIKFAELLKKSFEIYEIKKYFSSNPRLGSLGHICSEEQHAFLVEKKAVKHSIVDEVEDALLFGEMQRYFYDE